MSDDYLDIDPSTGRPLISNGPSNLNPQTVEFVNQAAGLVSRITQKIILEKSNPIWFGRSIELTVYLRVDAYQLLRRYAEYCIETVPPHTREDLRLFGYKFYVVDASTDHPEFKICIEEV